MHKAVMVIAAGLGFSVFASAQAMSCQTPQPPNLNVDGASLSVEAYAALTDQMARYDEARAAYVNCLNAVVLQEVDATPEEIDRARLQRSKLYVKDPATGRYSDPVADQYFKVTQAFMAGQEARAAEAAQEETRKSEAQLASKMMEAQSQ
jgi:hypothetical protein